MDMTRRGFLAGGAAFGGLMASSALPVLADDPSLFPGRGRFERLSINYHEIKAYRIYPPKDPQKFAKICEMMIRHFNEGWADGHHFGIRYWEIWNEPENPPMWKGTKEQFFELYRVTANHLKKCFPDLKIGGYASCGFYPLTRAESAKSGHWHWSFIDWFETFLDYVQAEETRAPLDFFSWHLYTSDPEEIVAHSKYVDEKLKEHGMENVENIFNEWNYITGRPDQFDEMKAAVRGGDPSSWYVFFLKPGGLVLSMSTPHASGCDHFEAQASFEALSPYYVWSYSLEDLSDIRYPAANG